MVIVVLGAVEDSEAVGLREVAGDSSNEKTEREREDKEE